MTSRLHRLIHGARVWRDTQAELSARLEAHLRKLREGQVRQMLALGPCEPDQVSEQLELPWEDLDLAWPEPPVDLEVQVELTARDHGRIARRVRRLLEARAAATGMAHLKDAERKAVEPRLAGVRLAGPRTEHAADELAAALMDEAPWMAEAIDHVWRGARRSAREGLGLGFSPLLLDGPPASGKTHLARLIAALAGTPLVEVDLGAGGEAFRLSGITRGWGTAGPGRPVEEILASGIGNPVVAVDETDKAGAARGSDGFKTSALSALLGLLEPGSASRWECPFYRLRFDLTRVCWVLLANDVAHLPSPLLSRVKVISVRPPSPAELCGVAFREGGRRGVDDESLELLARTILRARGAITLRHLRRALNELEAAQQQGPYH